MSSSAERRNARRARAAEVFGSRAEAALDSRALPDFPWHDCYGETSPPKEILEDIWTVADGDLGRFISASHLAVIDFRDLPMSADARRSRA